MLLAVGGAYAIASWNWCGRWEAAPAAIAGVGAASGALSVGAARAEVRVPFPIVIAGYGPPRPEAVSARHAIEARAVVLAVAPVKVAIVELDLLTAPRSLVERIRTGVAEHRFSEVLVVASHAHSSMGGYDERLVSEIAGTGSYRQDAADALVAAAVRALEDADAVLAPASVRRGTADAAGLVRARSGSAVDSDFTRLSFDRADGTGTVAEVWLLSAHPTLAGRSPGHLSPDYPGLVDKDDGPVTLILQSAGGNASAIPPEGTDGSPETRFAAAVTALAQSATGEARSTVHVGWSRVTFGMPRPDGSRLAPFFARAAGDNLLCTSAPREAEVSALRIDDFVVVALPAEPSEAAAAEIEQKSGASRVLGLSNGYLGYLEPSAVVKAGTGESKRQYFGPGLIDAIDEAAVLAVEAVRSGAH